jgi:hypothetical protein
MSLASSLSASLKNDYIGVFVPAKQAGSKCLHYLSGTPLCIAMRSCRPCLALNIHGHQSNVTHGDKNFKQYDLQAGFLFLYFIIYNSISHFNFSYMSYLVHGIKRRPMRYKV